LDGELVEKEEPEALKCEFFLSKIFTLSIILAEINLIYIFVDVSFCFISLTDDVRHK